MKSPSPATAAASGVPVRGGWKGEKPTKTSATRAMNASAGTKLRSTPEDAVRFAAKLSFAMDHGIFVVAQARHRRQLARRPADFGERGQPAIRVQGEDDRQGQGQQECAHDFQAFTKMRGKA